MAKLIAVRSCAMDEKSRLILISNPNFDEIVDFTSVTKILVSHTGQITVFSGHRHGTSSSLLRIARSS